jgi:hypothetical protein
MCTQSNNVYNNKYIVVLDCVHIEFYFIIVLPAQWDVLYQNFIHYTSVDLGLFLHGSIYSGKGYKRLRFMTLSVVCLLT